MSQIAYISLLSQPIVGILTIEKTQIKNIGLALYFIFLIALNGIIYEIDETLSVLMRDDGIYGIGSGASYAIGALHACASWNQAMSIAAKNNVFTAPPFITHKQTK